MELMEYANQDKTAALRRWCLDRLATHNDAAQRDPLASGVRMLSIDLWDRLIRGESDLDAIMALVKAVSDEALGDRARRLAAKAAPGDWRGAVEAAFTGLEGASFDDVARRLSQTRVGAVFTAHPTFAMSRALRAIAGRLASGGEAGGLEKLVHAPDADVTLRYEHDEAQAAIGAAQASIRALYGAVFDWLKARHPSHWFAARPALVSLATWVGYDLDGRTDIHWGETVRLRLEEKAVQLSRYAAALETVKEAQAIARDLAAAAEARAQTEMLAVDLNDPAAIVAAANRLTADRPERLVSLDRAKEKLGRLIATADDEARRALCILLCEMEAYGLGVARIHLRVNAAQVRSALRADLGFSPDQEFFDRTALDATAAKTAGALRRPVNFGDVFLEQMTARRQLMLCAQLLKHVDADTPIRFLIAEVEAPATVMGAIYLARLYGVDHRLDISPLFETPDAIEKGGRFVERLLEEEEFRRYVRTRGRLCIQCGFSDSGRFMGQVAADLAIERLHILVSRALAASGLGEIEVVLFNTHGESMGRGGHPGDFGARLDHLLTPWARARFARDGLSVNAECSFQGGDGFLHFQTPSLADATMRSLFSWSQRETARPSGDRFYDDINFSWDVYRTVKGWQESLFDNGDYQSALSGFSPNLLPATGSRKTRRQSGASKGDGARALRAIPHNAILQQLAAPANVLGGLGAAAAREPDRFSALMRQSVRMRSIFEMALTARRLTSLSILRTYASLYDPGFWTVRASRAPAGTDRAPALLVAERLALRSLDVRLGRLANVLSVDRQKFDAACRAIGEGVRGDDMFDANIYLLHAARIALVADGLFRVARTPPFSPRHELTRDGLVDMALDLRFAEVAAAIEEIFPESDAAPAAFDALAEPSMRVATLGGYPQVAREIVAPLRRLDVAIREIAVGISHFYDAFG